MRPSGTGNEGRHRCLTAHFTIQFIDIIQVSLLMHGTCIYAKKQRERIRKMKVACKNVNCKHYYSLTKGNHCQAEDECTHYTSNRKKAAGRTIRCKDCQYCKTIYTDGMRQYHYECTYNGRNKAILIIEERKCDVRL